MPRHSRKREYGKRRMRGGGWLDSVKAHANNAVAQAQNLTNFQKAQAAQQAAIDGANKAKGMIDSAHLTISELGQDAYSAAKPHLDTAQMHAQAAATHASNANFDGFKESMENMTGSLDQAHSLSQGAVLAKKTSDQMTIGETVGSLGNKASNALTGITKGLGFGSNPSGGARSRKHRRHTKKGRRRQSKSAKRRSYRSRKGGNQSPPRRRYHKRP